MSQRHVVAAALGALLSGCASLAPSGDVGVPDVRVGDSWTYNVVEEDLVDPKAKRLEYSFVRTVDRVTDAEIEVSETRLGSAEAALKNKFHRTWGVIRGRRADGRTISFSPHKSALVFPLLSSGSWTENYTWQAEGDYGWSELQTKRRVVGLQETTVPAGVFSTHEVELLTAGSFGPHKLALFVKPENWGGTQETYWYAPRVKNFVQYTEKIYVNRHLVAQTTVQLADYHIDGQAPAR